MKKFFSVLVLFAMIISIAAITSCSKDEWTKPSVKRQIASKEEDPPPYSVYTSAPFTSTCGTATEASLKADNSNSIGTVSVTNTDDTVYITYSTSGNWKMALLLLYVGDIASVPTDQAGNPDIQSFPYRATLDPTSDIVTFALPASLFNDTFAVAAFADVHKQANGNVIAEDSVWASGTKFTQSGVETYFYSSKKSCCTYDTLEYDIYADQTNKVGTLKVSNDAENLYITYTALNNWYFGKTYLYVGSYDKLPLKKSKDPDIDKFNCKKTHYPKVQTYTYTISLNKLPSSFIIAATSQAHKLKNGYVTQTEDTWSKGKHNYHKYSHSNCWGWYTTYEVQVCD